MVESGRTYIELAETEEGGAPPEFGASNFTTLEVGMAAEGVEGREGMVVLGMMGAMLGGVCMRGVERWMAAGRRGRALAVGAVRHSRS